MKSKGLIDLSRANKPPQNPLADKPPVKEKKAAPAKRKEPVANSNEPKSAVIPPVQEALPMTNERVSTLGARIPETLHQKIKLFCIANRMEMQHFVQIALAEHLAKLQGTDTSHS